MISRQAAIDAVQGIGRLATLPDNDAVVRMSAVEYVLFNLPSAQPERVYCCDCKYYDTEECMGRNAFYGLKSDDYCSMAERRTDEQTDLCGCTN